MLDWAWRYFWTGTWAGSEKDAFAPKRSCTGAAAISPFPFDPCSLMVVTLGIRSEAEEPILFRESIDPIPLGHLVAGLVLAGTRLHPGQLHCGGLAERGVPAGVALDDLLQQVGPLQHDAAAGRLGGGLAEVLEQLGLRHGLVEVAVVVVNRLPRELDDGAGLHVAEG